jgi:hypothetical protein
MGSATTVPTVRYTDVAGLVCDVNLTIDKFFLILATGDTKSFALEQEASFSCSNLLNDFTVVFLTILYLVLDV